MNSYKIFIKNFSTKYSNFIGINPKYQPYNPYIDLTLEDKLKERYAKKLAFWEIQRKNFSTTPKRDNMNAYANPIKEDFNYTHNEQDFVIPSYEFPSDKSNPLVELPQYNQFLAKKQNKILRNILKQFKDIKDRGEIYSKYSKIVNQNVYN